MCVCVCVCVCVCDTVCLKEKKVGGRDVCQLSMTGDYRRVALI